MPRTPRFFQTEWYIGISVILIALIVTASPAEFAVADPCGEYRAGLVDQSQDAESSAIASPARVRLRGDVPIDDYPDIQSRADAIWSHVARRFRLAYPHAKPEIQFYPFDMEVQSAEWTAWQKIWTSTHHAIWRDWTALRDDKGSSVDISQDWIDENIDEIFPFPGSFLAFHYDGTNRIQINPNRTFLASMQLDPYGMRRDMDGRGYYSMAHEMLHYALELEGVVPTKLHHCLMLFSSDDGHGTGIMETLADYLVEEGIIASSSRLLGLRAERMLAPCSRLDADELRRVEDLYASMNRPVIP